MSEYDPLEHLETVVDDLELRGDGPDDESVGDAGPEPGDPEPDEA